MILIYHTKQYFSRFQNFTTLVCGMLTLGFCNSLPQQLAQVRLQLNHALTGIGLNKINLVKWYPMKK